MSRYRDSSSGKLFFFGYSYSNTPYLLLGKYNSESSYNNNYGLYITDFTPRWFRIQDNGTDRICSISNDGRAFVEVYRVGRTDFLTPNQAGFAVDAFNGAPIVSGVISLISWSGVS
jgi:hypothetical protein